MHLQEQPSAPAINPATASAHELPVEMVTDIETLAHVPVPPKQAAPDLAGQAPTVPAKKKKKRKSSASSTSRSPAVPPSQDPLHESYPLPNEAAISGDGLDQWRARAINRRALLAKAAADTKILAADLAAALARVNDAEHAEAIVNKGLLTARSVISQRDRALADLTSSHSALKAEHAKLVEDKRRCDKRLVILKTVSANLQDTREARDTAERKLEDANSNSASLTKEIKALKEQVEALAMLKQQYARLENELDELSQSKQQLEVDSKRASVRAAGLGAAGAIVLSFSLRLLAGGKK